MVEMIDSMAEMQATIAESRVLKPEKNNSVQSFVSYSYLVSVVTSAMCYEVVIEYI
jgi:hypothetical protein